MRKILVSIIALLGLLYQLPVGAQEQQDRPERTKQPEFQKQIAVNYILVDAIVTDRHGRYVRNLTEDDFELYENGKLVTIQSLDEYQMFDTYQAELQQMSPDQVYMKQPPRNIIFFFDLLYSSSYGTRRAIEMAEKFILDRIQPGDRLMVVSYRNNLKTIQPFTADKTKAIEAMRRVGLTTTATRAQLEAPAGDAPGRAPGLTEYQLYEPGEEMGERIIQAESDHSFAVHNARNYLLSLEALAKAVKNYPGRKTLILLSEGLNYDLLDPTDKNQEDFGPLTRQTQDASTSGLTRPKLSLMPDYQDMVEILNDAKVSMYTINIGGLMPVGDATRQYGGADQLSEMQDVRPELKALQKRQEFLSGVAVDTSGRAYYNTNNILKLLNSVEVDVSNYYILGFRTEFDPKKSKYRQLKVKTKNSEYRVLHRKGFFTPRPFDSMSADERDMHLTEGFLSRNQINNLGASVGYQFIRTTPKEMKAAVCLNVPLEQLDVDRGKLDVEVLATNIDSEAKIFSSVHKRYIISAGDEALERKGVSVVENLGSTMGLNRVRIAVRDNNTGKRSYFYYNYVLKESDPAELLFSQPLFYDPNDFKRVEDEFDVKIDLPKTWNEPPTGGFDPIRHPNLGSIFPECTPEYAEGDEIHFFATIYNIGRRITEVSELEFQYAISPAPVEGKEREYYGVTVGNFQIYRFPGASNISISADFPMSKLEPGVYDLFLLVTDTKTGRKAASAGRLIVVD